MEVVAIGLQILIWVFVGIAIIYLIIRRIDIREREDFDKRDN